ncbi:myelin-associated glycoprotein-like isoform X1 [Pygocentrus nattereri]|uniref:myelin-associated glycoprotein-like isoform X1 n=1 Tax=Pygocentrus nattereri TaxID=42514 RepID=UPI001891DDB3|nr:myelin-associated glycoprotein-like isoform X1 [Pygocentrus nattereri]
MRQPHPAMERYKLFLTVSVLSCLGHGWEVQVPKSVKAVEGSCVKISCHTSSHNEVKWYKYKGMGYPVVYSRSTADILQEFRGRTSVPGSPSQGDCSLQLNNVRQEDNGISLYPWIYPETSNNEYKYIEINVVNPEIHISVSSPQMDGNLSTANCTVQHSCPSSPPPVQWVGLSSVSNSLISTTFSEGLWTSVTRAQFRANRLYHSSAVSCRATLNSKYIYSTAVGLNVFYTPTDVKVGGADEGVVEGDMISLTCTSNSNPEPTDYEWLVTQKGSTTTRRAPRTFPLGSVRRDTSVSCTARNSVGRGQSESVLLNVHFAPTILMNSSCFVSAGGVRCVCRAEAEPNASIFWMVDGSRAVLPHFSTTTRHTGRITVSELTGPPASNVSCEASNIVGTNAFQCPLSEGNSGSMVAAVVCTILGIAVVVAICLKKRRQRPADSTFRSRTESNGKNIVLNLNDNIYANNAAGEDIYVNTEDTPQTNEDDGDDIYQNY